MVNDSQIKCVLLTLLILASLLLLTASVVLILLISAGLMANSSVSAALCSPYLTTKFGGTSYVTLNAFIASCIAVFGALVFFLTAASTIIVAYFKSSPNRACSITIARLIILYLSNCFTLLASVVTFGYYLSVIIEKDQCLGATNDREIIITAL